MSKTTNLSALSDVVDSVDSNGNIILRKDNGTYNSTLTVQQTDQRIDIGSYWEAGVDQCSYIIKTGIDKPLHTLRAGCIACQLPDITINRS